MSLQNNQQKQKLLIITGPTATGKTDAAVSFAEKIGGEIISADSMLVYRHMDIGTAKPTGLQMEKVPHHMVNVADPWESFSVVMWREGAKKAIDSIVSRGKMPIVAGGTGLYIRSLLYPMSFAGGDADGEVRKKWESFLNEHGAEALHDRLAAIDPQSAQRLPQGDTRRIIRALEIFETTGITMTQKVAEDEKKEPEYIAISLGISLPRVVLYDRINQRVDKMIKAGLVKEVQSLLDMGVPRDATSMQGLGYKEIAAFLQNECTLDEAIDTLKRRTRNFAKRQITWFKKYGDISWLCPKDDGAAIENKDIFTFFEKNYDRLLKM